LNIRFPGQYYDQETGLHYNYFRYYDPSTGRYINSDPVGLGGGLNTYAYVGNNPLKYLDFYGLDSQMCYRPFYPIPQLYARHCFLEFSDGSSSSFDPDGTHEDPAPDWWPKSCQDTEGEQDDDCLKRAMMKCKADQYDFTGFNCCHCVEQAMRECGLNVPRDGWPNWPVNPGPQPGEPGYHPIQQYGVL
jgi:RHS repeat-associated protein